MRRLTQQTCRGRDAPDRHPRKAIGYATGTATPQGLMKIINARTKQAPELVVCDCAPDRTPYERTFRLNIGQTTQVQQDRSAN